MTANNVELLEKFKDFLLKKQCETIEISGSCDESGTLYFRFDNELKLEDNYSYYVSLLSFEAPSLFPNVTETGERANNKFYYITNTNENKVITLLTGGYNISDIAKDIKEQCGENVVLELNEATGRSVIKLSNGYKVDFTKPNTIRNLLGFVGTDNAVVLSRTTVSPKSVDVLTSEKIYIYCSIIKGSYYSDGKLSTILYSFANSKRYGSMISFRPNPVQKHVLTQKNISEIFISFKDDKKHPITFNGSNVHLTLQIKQA